MAYIKNWRDQQPEVAHLSAIRWPGLRQRNATPKHGEDDSPQLHNIQGIVKHGLQGRKTSDHHKHQQVRTSVLYHQRQRRSPRRRRPLCRTPRRRRVFARRYLPSDVQRHERRMARTPRPQQKYRHRTRRRMCDPQLGRCFARKRWRGRDSLASTRPCRRRKHGMLKIHRLHRPRSRTTRPAEHCAML